MNVSAVQGHKNSDPSFGMSLSATSDFVRHHGKDLAKQLKNDPQFAKLNGKLDACGTTTFIEGRIGGFLGMGGKKVEGNMLIADVNNDTICAKIIDTFELNGAKKV